jgi:5-formyltetrahydrofolate cyclo-ligase
LPSAEKAEIRKRVLAARDALAPASRRDLCARITARLLALPGYRDARCVMAYVGFGTELDTGPFIADLLSCGKTLVLPRVERSRRSLVLHAVRDPETELAAGVWGIREPRADLCAEVAPAAVDFVLVPGVAFTARCERLGYGGGFYDRLIPELTRRPVLAAAAYSLQIVPELPVTPADRSVDLVVTEDARYERRES